MDGDEGRKVESQETTNFPAGPKAKVMVETGVFELGNDDELLLIFFFFKTKI